MKIECKEFSKISIDELYEILKLRNEIFIIEQNCIYQDLDNKDQQAIHIIGKNNEKIIAYARVFDKGKYFENASIGRVLVQSKFRRKNFGKIIVNESIKYITEKLKRKKIEISAQKYLLKFYNDLGFKKIGEEYLEDGIPHYKMLYTKDK